MKRLLLAPLVAVVLFFAGEIVLAGQHDALRLFTRVMVIAAAALAAGGSVASAAGFERGDYLRTAWIYSAITYVAVAAASVLRIPADSTAVLVARAIVVFIANVISVAGMILFARAFRVAGLEFPGTHRRKVTIFVVAAVVGILAAGYPFAYNLQHAFRGELDSITGAISSLGDIATFVLIAPIYMTAAALSGGLLQWPWALLTAANIGWLLFDAQDTITYFVPNIIGERLEEFSEPWRILACVLTFCAGLAQRRLTRGTDDGTASAP